MSAAAASAPTPTKAAQPPPYIAIVVDGNDGAKSGFLASFPIEYLEHLVFFIQTALLVRLAQYGLPVGDFNPPPPSAADADAADGAASAQQQQQQTPQPHMLHAVKVARRIIHFTEGGAPLPVASGAAPQGAVSRELKKAGWEVKRHEMKNVHVGKGESAGYETEPIGTVADLMRSASDPRRSQQLTDIFLVSNKPSFVAAVTSPDTAFSYPRRWFVHFDATSKPLDFKVAGWGHRTGRLLCYPPLATIVSDLESKRAQLHRLRAALARLESERDTASSDLSRAYARGLSTMLRLMADDVTLATALNAAGGKEHILVDVMEVTFFAN